MSIQTGSRTAARADNIALAVSVIVITVLSLSLGDALIKSASGAFVLWQIFILRSVLALIPLIGYLKVKRPEILRLPQAPGWTALRSLMLAGMWVAYYAALPHLDLSTAAAAYYTLPIFITLFSALFIGDRISLTGWSAVFIGFAGVLLILRPQADDFNAYALLPILSAILYALAMILTRTKCRAVHPVMLSVSLNLAFILVGAVASLALLNAGPDMGEGFLTGPWTAMGTAEWLTMALLAAATLIGSVGNAIAYQNGPPSVIGIFDFAYVGFALLWGMVIFAERPDAAALTGMALIVAAGVMSLRQ